MQKQLQQIKEFHQKFGSLWQDNPAPVDAKTQTLRTMLMESELKEVVDAMQNEPIENIAKELADVLCTVYGTIGSYGLAGKMEQIFDEVHRSNMSKTGSDANGKAVKGPDYSPANVAGILTA